MMNKTTNKFTPEVRARAVRMVLDHEKDYASRWAAMVSVSAKLGCSAKTLSTWVRRTEVDTGQRIGQTTDERERIKAPNLK
jgi:transposase